MKYLGIDWATEEHVVVLVEEDGSQVAEWRVVHAWPGISALLEQLEDEGGPESVLVAIEAGAARLTSALVVSGYEVYEINPKQSDRFRDRFSPAGAKDDRRDALVLAHAIRTDRQWLRPVVLAAAEDQELKARCRDRRMLIDHRRRLQQQLRQALRESHPAALELGMKLHRAFVLELLLAYPDAQRARRAKRSRLSTLLTRHRIRKCDVEQLRELLRQEDLPLADGLRAAYADKIVWLVRAIQGLNRSIGESEAAIADRFAEHRDHEILKSIPGAAEHLAPEVVAEIATSVGPRPTALAVQQIGGTCPTTRRSGKQTHGLVRMRKHCNRVLQAALFNCARCSRAGSPWARAYYDHRRTRGASHNAAIRALSNKWAKILATLLERRETYDEERHLADLRRAGVPWVPALEGASA